MEIFFTFFLFNFCFSFNFVARIVENCIRNISDEAKTWKTYKVFFIWHQILLLLLMLLTAEWLLKGKIIFVTSELKNSIENVTMAAKTYLSSCGSCWHKKAILNNCLIKSVFNKLTVGSWSSETSTVTTLNKEFVEFIDRFIKAPFSSTHLVECLWWSSWFDMRNTINNEAWLNKLYH